MATYPRPGTSSGGHGDVQWLDDDAEAAAHDHELLAAGSSRPPLRRGTRIALGVLAAAAVGAAVTAAVTSTGGSQMQVAPVIVTVTPTRSTTPVPLPPRPPAAALAAIRAAFPRAELTSFSAALAAGTVADVFRFYNVTVGRRLVTVTVGPLRPSEPDAVLRTETSLEIAQQLGDSRVRIQLRVTRGSPNAADFAAIQALVLDARLLATR